MLKLTSRQNPQIKMALKLQNRRERDALKLFLIEGYRELKRAFDGKISLQKLFFCPSLFLGENEQKLITQIQASGGQLIECNSSVFERLSYRDRPDGLIAIAQQMQTSFSSLKTKEVPFFIVAESIEKPGNLGSILRSADGVGADGVIICDRCTDIYNPNVVRASVGTLFTLPVIEAESSATLSWLKEQRITIVATTPSAKTSFTRADFSKPLAIVVGTEQLGLSEKWLQAADLQVSIPMRGAADSLNVATATTLLLYEVLRQRTKRNSLETTLL